MRACVRDDMCGACVRACVRACTGMYGRRLIRGRRTRLAPASVGMAEFPCGNMQRCLPSAATLCMRIAALMHRSMVHAYALYVACCMLHHSAARCRLRA